MAGGAGDGDDRQAHLFFAAAEDVEDGLDGCGLGLPEVGLHEREEVAVDAAGGGPVVADGGADHVGHLRVG